MEFFLQVLKVRYLAFDRSHLNLPRVCARVPAIETAVVYMDGLPETSTILGGDQEERKKVCNTL